LVEALREKLTMGKKHTTKQRNKQTNKETKKPRWICEVVDIFLHLGETISCDGKRTCLENKVRSRSEKVDYCGTVWLCGRSDFYFGQTGM